MCDSSPKDAAACTHRREFLAGSLFVAGAAALASPAAAQQGAKKVWMCPPCGCASDGKEFDKPGSCPSCGMPLEERTASANPAPTPPRPKVAILLFEGVQIIDFTGPYEVFGQAGYEVFTVGQTKAPLKTAMQLTVTPTYAFGENPKPDVLLVPGGGIGSAMNSPATLDWIRDQSAQSQITMSVCNGALIIAKAGLLDGLTATTFNGAIDDLIRTYPKVKVVSDKRFVDNGRIITTAGLSSGIDGAMHVITRLDSQVRAQVVARNLEYDWNEKGTYARGVLADYPLGTFAGSSLGLPADYKSTIEKSAGDRKTWEAVWKIETQNPAVTVADALEATAQRAGRFAEKVSKPSTQRTWKFTDPRGRAWGVRLDVSDRSPGVKEARITSMLGK